MTKEIKETYAQGLGKMIACPTISHKDQPYDDTPFKALRQVVEELFPHFHQQANRTIFSDDCWFYHLPGIQSNQKVMVMSHHDVVAANEKEPWRYPPFEGVVAEGAIWGRGAVDTKGPLYAQFQAIEELLAEGWVSPYDLYLLSSHNEEYGGDGAVLVAKWCAENHITFDLILDEGGAIIPPPMPGISKPCAMVAVHEKGRCKVRCTAKDASSHLGLTPKMTTSITRMAQFINQVANQKLMSRKLYPEVKAMFTILAPHMAFPYKILFSNLWLFGPLLLALMPKLNPQAGAMVGTQFSFNTIEGSTTNHNCSAEVFFRCIRDEDLKKDLQTFTQFATKHGIEVEVLENEYYPPADLHSSQLAYVKNCIQKVFPQVVYAPYLLPAGTDARHFSHICSAVLRFAPVTLSAQQFASVHGKDENLGVDALAQGVVFYKELLRNYPLF